MSPEAELAIDNPNAWNRPLVDVGADQPITFGDTVRVRTTKEAEAAGLAGLVGEVVGETMPSTSGQEVALRPKIDYAIGVHFEELGQTLFLPHEVLEFIDHAPGQQVSFETSRGKVTWVRLESGEWREVEGAAVQPTPAEVRTAPEAETFLQRVLRFLGVRT